jgi:hypothetical protein
VSYYKLLEASDSILELLPQPKSSKVHLGCTYLSSLLHPSALAIHQADNHYLKKKNEKLYNLFYTDCESDVAKFMLVVMVRGITTDLKFPIAGFATMSITTGFLYPVSWKAIRILETSIVNLKVLFITNNMPT